MPERLAGATEPTRTMVADLRLISVSPKSGQGASTPSRFPPPRFGSRELVNFPTCIARQGIRASCAAAQRCPLSRLMGLPDGVAASIEVARLAQAELLGHAVIIEDFTEV